MMMIVVSIINVKNVIMAMMYTQIVDVRLENIGLKLLIVVRHVILLVKVVLGLLLKNV